MSVLKSNLTLLMCCHPLKRKRKEKGKETFSRHCDQSVVSDWHVGSLGVSSGLCGWHSHCGHKWVFHSWFSDSSITDVSHFLNPSEFVSRWWWQRWISAPNGLQISFRRLSTVFPLFQILYLFILKFYWEIIGTFFFVLKDWIYHIGVPFFLYLSQKTNPS